MAVNYDKLIFHKVKIGENYYMLLDPQTGEELVFGMENNLLIPGKETKIEEIDPLSVCLN